jgi:uncharacterized SAM-binding protein YcdF (DUF218 family)
VSLVDPFLRDLAELFRWSSCPPRPLEWFGIRDSVLHLVATPFLLLPLLAGLLWVSFSLLPLSRSIRACLVGAALLCVSLVYTPIGTSLLSTWLRLQMPPPTTAQPSVAVLVGRGWNITQATTSLAADLERWGLIHRFYVSGDQRSTAERLVALGVPPTHVAGDDCARTTWENAILTTAWLRQQNPGAPLPAITLITDPWQLPRAARAFRRQGVAVLPMAASVDHLSAREKNRLALRESAALLLYRLQGRA